MSEPPSGAGRAKNPGVAQSETRMREIERRRNLVNNLILFLPSQWLTLMLIYWIKYFPALRPYEFEGAAPSRQAFLIGCAASLVPFVLPKGWFVPRRFESGSFYRRLGLRWFRYVAPDGDLANRHVRSISPDYRVIRNRENLRTHLEETINNERWHLSFLTAGVLTSIHAVCSGRYAMAIGLTLSNVVFNLFPVFHQRHKRVRARRSLFGLADQKSP